MSVDRIVTLQATCDQCGKQEHAYTPAFNRSYPSGWREIPYGESFNGVMLVCSIECGSMAVLNRLTTIFNEEPK